MSPVNMLSLVTISVMMPVTSSVMQSDTLSPLWLVISSITVELFENPTYKSHLSCILSRYLPCDLLYHLSVLNFSKIPCISVICHVFCHVICNVTCHIIYYWSPTYKCHLSCILLRYLSCDLSYRLSLLNFSKVPRMSSVMYSSRYLSCGLSYCLSLLNFSKVSRISRMCKCRLQLDEF